MTSNTLATWHKLVESRNPGRLDSLLFDSVVFHSPVVNPPMVGKAATIKYLATAFRVFFNDSFGYVR